MKQMSHFASKPASIIFNIAYKLFGVLTISRVLKKQRLSLMVNHCLKSTIQLWPAFVPEVVEYLIVSCLLNPSFPFLFFFHLKNINPLHQ